MILLYFHQFHRLTYLNVKRAFIINRKSLDVFEKIKQDSLKYYNNYTFAMYIIVTQSYTSIILTCVALGQFRHFSLLMIIIITELT